jgi:hypothetical protein
MARRRQWPGGRVHPSLAINATSNSVAVSTSHVEEVGETIAVAAPVNGLGHLHLRRAMGTEDVDGVCAHA